MAPVLRVLILAYDYEPLPSIAAQRPYCWYKYLPGFGAQVTVITRQWPAVINSASDYVKPVGEEDFIKETDSQGNTVIRVPFRPAANERLLLAHGLQRRVYLRKALSLLNSILPFIALRLDNRAAIYRAADSYLAKNRVDIIIATGEPLILFRYAALLSKKHKTPWAADYRDAFTSEQGNNKRYGIASLLNKVHRFFERRYLQSVSFITTAAPSYAELISKYAGHKTIHVVYNGYDAPASLKTMPVPVAGKFKIAYGGILYAHQRLDMFFAGLRLFMQQHANPQDVEVVFYGLQPQADMVNNVRQAAGDMQALLTFTPRYAYKDILAQFAGCHVLLLLSAKGANWLNAKVFDYMAAGRPVLLVENDKGVLEHLVTTTKIGSGAADAGEVAAFLASHYASYKRGEPTLVNAENTEFYTRQHQAGELFGILKKELKKG